MEASFVRERITQLRMAKGVSEYKMSYDLGHSRGYINNISSGKALPSLTELFAICDYFEITPVEFFSETVSNPKLQKTVIADMELMREKDLLLVQALVERMLQK